MILLRNVLIEAARINSRMTDIVADLHLDGLVEALTKIREHFAGTPAETDVTIALEGLAALRPRLSGLMQEHYEWQIIDKAIGVAGLIPGSTLADRFLEWPDTHPAPEPVGTGRRTSVGRDAQEGSSVARNRRGRPRPVQVRSCLRLLRIVARARFFEVDDMLLRQSGSLATVAPVLDKLL